MAPAVGPDGRAYCRRPTEPPRRLDGHLREGGALLARRAVAEVADRVERLPGATRGDDDAPTGQGPLAPGSRCRPGEDLAAGGIQLGGLGKAARAGCLNR